MNKKLAIMGTLAFSIFLAIGLFLLAGQQTTAEIGNPLTTKANLGKIKELGNISNIGKDITWEIKLLNELNSRHKNRNQWKSCTISKTKQHENLTYVYVHCDFPTAKLDISKLPADNQCRPKYNDDNMERCNISIKWIIPNSDYNNIIK